MGVDVGSLGTSVEESESLTAPVSSEQKAQRWAEREAAPEDRGGSEKPEQGVNLHRCHQITQLPGCPFEFQWPVGAQVCHLLWPRKWFR